MLYINIYKSKYIVCAIKYAIASQSESEFKT